MPRRHTHIHARRVTITAIVVDAILAGGVVARAWSGYLAVLVRPCGTPPRAGACEVKMAVLV